MAPVATQIGPAPKRASAAQSERSARARRHLVDCITAAAFLGDTASVLCGLITGFWIRFKSGWITFGVESHVQNLSDYYLLFCVGLLFYYLAFFHLRFYDPRTVFRFRTAALVIAKGTVFWVLTYLGTSLVLKFEQPISRIYAFCSFFCIFGFLLAWRGLLSRILQSEIFARQLRQRILILGWTEDVSRLLRVVEGARTHFYEVLGYVPLPSANGHAGVPPVAALGNFDSLEALLQQHQPDAVVLADNNLDQAKIIGLINLCEKHFVDFKTIPSYFQIMVSGLHLEYVNGVPMLGVAALPLDRLANRVLKRCVDIVGSIAGLLLSAPIVPICALLIWLESPGPIFYWQIRCGYKGRLFKIAKLRSMRLDAEVGGARWATKNDPRRLKIGILMRKWNLDELPQFWNVLKGEMTLVGPRPERPELIKKFLDEIPHYNARHFSKPGLTGWAQVNGYRGETSLVERVKCDLFYLENWSVWLDLQIMVQTLFRHENAG
jgi:exopolysaccharide biosynthesis polyprenyl glycosylphosphotransferase